MEVYHDDFENFTFVNQRMVQIIEEGDEEGISETTSQVKEGQAQRIINTDQYTERVS